MELATSTTAAAFSPRLELNADWLRVTFSPARGDHADFHYIWLRHNSDGDRHPQTGERLLDSSEIDTSIHPRTSGIENDTLVIGWSDGASSRYPLKWLSSHAYAKGRKKVPSPPSSVSKVEVHAAGLTVDEVVDRSLETVLVHGIVVVRGFSTSPTSKPEDDTEPLIQAFEKRRLPIVKTHFGRIEDLRPDNTTNQNTDQLGYTDSGIDLHTDQPFLENPPKWQLLQAIVPATSGGDSFIADARAAADYLKSFDAHAYQLLTTVPVHFHRKQKAFERLVVSPVVTPDGPRDFQVRFSYFTMDPHRVPFDSMLSWYSAYNRFTKLVRDPANQYRFRLDRGDFVLYDNLRMLHGRTPFQGPRWLRGIYFEEPIDQGFGI